MRCTHLSGRPASSVSRTVGVRASTEVASASSMGRWYGERAANLAARSSRYVALQVLAGVGDGVEGPAGLGALASGDQRADVHDPLALLARDAGPVVRVGGVGQVLVLAELVHARVQQVLQAQPLLAVAEEVLDGHLLAPVDDVLDHRAGVEVFEVQDL